MQVAIARDYFPAYARLPRKAQRKADEFLRKFTADPRQASIHYEAVKGAQDKQLRSVRVGDDYRAIVREPEHGDTFLLLWVDHHDEAYRWAASKQTAVHPATGTLQLFDVEAAARVLTQLAPPPEAPTYPRASAGPRPEPVSIAAPSEHEAARLFAAFSDDELFQGGVPRALIPAVRAVVTDDDLDQLVPHVPTDAGEILTGLAAGFTLDALLEELLVRPVVAATTKKPEVDPADVAAALERPSTQQQFRIVDDEFNLDAALAHPLDVWRVYLHPKQRAIATARTKGPVRVTGGPGTGKTVVAIHRAAFLVREVVTKPDDRVLFTTFTVNLVHDVVRQLEKLLEPRELARIEVKNLDAWASEYLRNRGEPVRFATNDMQEEAWTRVLDVYAVDGFSPEFCKTEWRDVVQAQNLLDEEGYVACVRLNRGVALSRRDRRSLWPLFQAYRQELSDTSLMEPVQILRRARERIEADPTSVRYRSVVVDETQDLSLEALKLARAIAGPEHPDDLFLVGDGHQRIYGRATSLASAGINVRGRRSQQLRLNYRTTAAICRWSLGALGKEEMADLDGGAASRRGYVSLREGQPPTLRGFEHVAEEVAFVVGEVKRLLAAGTPAEGICITARTKQPLDRYLDALGREGIAADLLEREEPRHPSVRLATMHRIKGLEFPAVFVVDVDADEVPLRRVLTESSDPVVIHHAELAERCLLYVAASRARDALCVSYTGNPSPFLAAMAPPPVKSVAPPSMPRRPTDAPAAATSSPSTSATPDARALALDGLELPARVLSWAERKGISTLGELAALTPSDLLGERNFGRRSIADARAAIESAFGMSWEEAGAVARDGPAAGTLPTAPSSGGWDDRRRSLPAALAAVALADLKLPSRARSYVEREGLVTVGDLATKSSRDLSAVANLGRRSVRQMLAAIEEHEEHDRASRERAALGLLPSWKALLQELETIPRMVLTRRAGLGGEPEKLHAIGEILGVTRERVRQIESRALEELSRERGWLSEARAHVDAVLAGGAAPLDEVSIDPWWQAGTAMPWALEYFAERLLDGAFHIVDLDGREYMARAPQATLDATWSALHHGVEAFNFPTPLSSLDPLLQQARDAVGGTLATALSDRLRGQLHMDESGGQPRVLGLGSGRADAFVALLRASPTPLRVEELWARLGRCKIPEEVFFFGSGVVGVERHFPDFTSWKERLVPLAVEVMERDAPDRQWLAGELLDEIREEHDLPEWLTQWHLGAALRRSDRVRYLGRLRVALPNAVEEGGRIHFHEELARILRNHGAPVLREDLVAELRAKTGVNELTLLQALARPLFLRCADDHIGLLERDLPGGAEALAEAAEEVATVLEQKQRGLGAAQLRAEVAKLSATHAQWSAEMCLSVLRGDPRFRLSIAGAVGLASWEGVRVPNRLELVRQCLNESSGKVTVDAVQRRIEAYYGAAPERVGIGLMANRLGASLRGEWLEGSPVSAGTAPAVSGTLDT